MRRDFARRAGVGNVCPEMMPELPQAFANLADDNFAFGLTNVLASVA
jgi:hypothetical protein